jgi:hypothetical protein
MADFKPDIVIFIEDSPCDSLIVESRIKALVLNEISSKVQTKMFLFHEIGPLNLTEAKAFYRGQPA